MTGSHLDLKAPHRLQPRLLGHLHREDTTQALATRFDVDAHRTMIRELEECKSLQLAERYLRFLDMAVVGSVQRKHKIDVAQTVLLLKPNVSLEEKLGKFPSLAELKAGHKYTLLRGAYAAVELRKLALASELAQAALAASKVRVFSDFSASGGLEQLLSGALARRVGESRRKAQRARHSSEVSLDDEELGDILGSSIGRRVVDTQDDTTWVMDLDQRLHIFEGGCFSEAPMKMVANPADHLAIVGDETADERLCLFTSSMKRFEELVRYGANLIWHSGNNHSQGCELTIYHLLCVDKTDARRVMQIFAEAKKPRFRSGNLQTKNGYIYRRYAEPGRRQEFIVKGCEMVDLCGDVLHRFSTESEAAAYHAKLEHEVFQNGGKLATLSEWKPH